MAGLKGQWQKDASSYTRPKEICWIDSNITSILQLALNSGLVSLNLHCNRVSKIEGLDSLSNLKHLDLSSNQIAKMEGLGALMSLRTLNLSCNKIKVVEGMENLNNLCKFDASYNFIDNISGIKDLHGSNYHISHIYLHGNQLSSLEHAINSLIGCVKLKELTFELYGDRNPLCVLKGYRSSLLSTIRSIEVLDGVDREGRPATVSGNDQDIPELEEYLDFLLSSSSSEAVPIKDVRFDVATPRIDLVLNKFRSRPVLSESDISTGTTPPCKDQPTFQKPSNKVRLSVDHEVRLEKLENQLANLLYADVIMSSSKREKSVDQQESRTNYSEESDSENSPTCKANTPRNTRSLRTRVPPKRIANKKTISNKTKIAKSAGRGKSSTTTSPTSTSGGDPSGDIGTKVTGKSVFTTKNVRKPEDDATLLSLIQELEAERERRWKAEQAGRKLVDHIKAMQKKDAEEKSLQEAAIAASARLKQALIKEREFKAMLQNTNDELQTKNKDLLGEVQRLKESNEEQRKTIRSLEDAASKMEDEMFKKHAHEASKSQEHQIEAAAKGRELELLQQTSSQLKGQLQQLQELLVAREQEHKNALEGMVKIESQEMRSMVECEIAKHEARYEQVISQYQQSLQKKDVAYAALEDEFRMGLQLEANRFKELQDAFEHVSDEAAQYKLIIQASTQKESKANNMVNELTAMVKEQRARLSELSKGRHEILSEYKERIQHLEAQLNDARRQLTQLEILQQDKSKLGAQIRAQESVIEGLRNERKLWSQELAQQGSSLAQDRGRLESRIEALTAELNQLKKQSQSENETIQIKSKMIEDQTDSIKKLKQAVMDRDNDFKKLQDESYKAISDLEKQLAHETANSQQLQEEADVLSERKRNLKKELQLKQEELEETKEGLRALRSKWQEKSALIGQMETEVVKMRDSFKEKELALISEKDKAVATSNDAVERMKAADDAFRRQLESEKNSHQKQVKKLLQEKQDELDCANKKVLDVEDEMRMLLQENAVTKKTLEMRIKKLTSAFTEIQQDLATS